MTSEATFNLERTKNEVMQELKNSAFCGFSSTIDFLQKKLGPDDEKFKKVYRDAINSLVEQGKLVIREEEITLAERFDILGSWKESSNRAKYRYDFASSFLKNVLSCSTDVLTAGISGSVSYDSAGENDDVDIIVIAKDGTLWTVLWKLLLEARKKRKLFPGGPIICLSYCMEDTPFRKEAEKHRTRLFASDFLNTKVVMGMPYFKEVLMDNSWMADFYPRSYARLAGITVDPDCMENQATASVKGKWNGIKYLVAGTYLGMFARVRNLRFSISGMSHSKFKANIAVDRCIYESSKWNHLEKLSSRNE
ncbi:MAG: hypothetical protein M1351_06110 [Candidatus Thermoplasmatota archaeon]|nr:hypothetical protein [Candidatus Thermoplasmatota archaeon]